MLYVPETAIDVLLTTEGTYPIIRGGVSTWCDMLVRGVRGVRYHIYTIIGTPHLPARYQIPTGTRITRVPMWGTEEPTEHLDIRFSTVYERKLRTTANTVQREFLPLFDELLHAILGSDRDGRSVGQLLYQMYLFFQEHDYLETFKSGSVWDFYLKGTLRDRWVQQPAPPSILDALQTMGWLYRFLIVLNTPVPRTDVIHSSAAAFCGLPGVLGKLAHRTPFMLTEHGVYLREQYLSVGRSSLSPYAKEFLLGLIKMVTAANYAFADLVAPVAAFNARWERRLGVPDSRIRVIYNGVDPDSLAPRPRPQGAPPTVVSVARIDPVKDILSLIRAAAQVRQELKDVRFIVYGTVSVPGYYQECLALRDELGLGGAFLFAGHVADVSSAYNSGDVVVLSSITEGFPYAVIEAMMCGRPVIATDVGGNREACEGGGLLVPPKNPTEMAGAILKMLRDPAYRQQLADEGRDRALTYFTIQRNLALYRNAYEQLSARITALPPLPALVAHRRELSVRRAQALELAGELRGAIQEYRMAVDLDPYGPSAPPLVLQIAALYLQLGEVQRSWQEIERAEALLLLQERQLAA